MGPGISSLLSQVIKFKRNLVLGIQKFSISQITMFCYQNLLIVTVNFYRSKLVQVVLCKRMGCSFPEKIVIIKQQPNIIENLIEFPRRSMNYEFCCYTHLLFI